MKLNLNMSTTDIEGVLKYFDIVNQREVDVQEFVKNFLEKYKTIEQKEK